LTNSRILASTPSSLLKSTSVVHTKPTLCGYSEGLARSLLLEPTPLAANDSQEFKVHIIGDNNIILRPPQQYITARKPPPMFVEITRNGEAIDSELSKLFDGVYTVVIPSDDAWGLMKVSVHTKSKPLIKESFELDFGRRWLKLTGWKKMATQQKEKLMKLAEQASIEGKRIVGEVNQKTVQFKQHTQNLLVNKAADLSDKLSKQASKFPKVSLEGLRVDRFLPETDYIKKAQRQAVHVWEKIEVGRRRLITCRDTKKCDKKPL